MSPFAEKAFDWLWLLAWGIASSAWCLSASGELSATFDEPVYVKEGLEHWRTGSYKGLLRLGTMPLPVDVETLPIYLYERWRGEPFDFKQDFASVLPWARAGALCFWWLLLLYVWLSARQLAGPWAGRLAVALIAFEPSFLAHASLATTDIAVTACLVALVYHYRMGRDERWWKRVGLPAGWFGLAVLAKASALVFGPLCMLAVELERILKEGPQECPFLRRFRWKELIQIGIGGVLLTFVYCGSDWEPEPTFVAWANKLPDGVGRTCMVWIAEHLCIFSNAGVGLVRQVTHNVRGHSSYLLGQEHPRALWYYFPVVLTIKMSPPLLLTPLLLLAVRPRSLLNWACLSAAFLLAFSLACRVQIGVRFMLPLVALAVAGLSAALVIVCRELQPGWRRSLIGAGTVGAVCWTTASACSVWPHALCYVNELWGGTAQGYRIVSEGNYDWGQGLKELARWRTEHDLPELDVWYYGSDPTVKQMRLHELPLHVKPIQQAQDLPPRLHSRYLAVSTSLLYGSSYNREEIRRSRDILRQLQPIARTSTFFIYDFGKGD